jgi:hypothetical protein
VALNLTQLLKRPFDFGFITCIAHGSLSGMGTPFETFQMDQTSLASTFLAFGLIPSLES